MRTNSSMRWLLAGLVLLVCAGCSITSSQGPEAAVSGTPVGTQTFPAGEQAVKVALLLPMTGPGNTQQVAKALKQAGELALFDFNNPNVQLAPKDTKGTAAGARAAAAQAIQEGAELIVGPLFAAEVAAVAPEAQRAGIPVIAFSSDQKVAGNGVYLLSFLPGREVQRIVAFTAARGKQRFAALVPQNEYGRIVEETFTRAVQESGGQVVTVQHFPPDANGMMEPVKQIASLAKKNHPPQIDALFVPGGANDLPSLAPLMPYFELDTANVKLIGTAGWDYPGAGKEVSLLGGWFAASDPKGWQDFTKRYAETYSDQPPRLASLAYDAVSLAVSLSGNPRGQRFTPNELTRASGFAGIDGLFRLRADGTAERGFAVLEVQRYGNHVIDAAPQSFGGNPQY